MNLLQQVQKRGLKLIRGLEHLSHGDKLEIVRVVQTKEGRSLGRPYSSSA